jgi:hypothetical protein
MLDTFSGGCVVNSVVVSVNYSNFRFTLVKLDPRIKPNVKEVNYEIPQHYQYPQSHNNALDQHGITSTDGANDLLAHARQCKQIFEDNGTSQKSRKKQRRQG